MEKEKQDPRLDGEKGKQDGEIKRSQDRWTSKAAKGNKKRAKAARMQLIKQCVCTAKSEDTQRTQQPQANGRGAAERRGEHPRCN